MGFYSRFILPTLLNGAMKRPDMLRLRHRLIPEAAGDVLEIGIGSGLNLPLYPEAVRSVQGIEPSDPLRRMAQTEAETLSLPLELSPALAEALPFPDRHFDTVVSTWTLCSIAELGEAIAEIRRVLKPEGRFLFVEHGQAPDASVHRWQNRLTPIWKRIGGGCHLNRRIARTIEDGGFAFDHLEQDYLVQGPKWATYTFLGAARAR